MTNIIFKINLMIKKIHSKYLTQKFFGLMKTKQYMEIIRYNKDVQKRMEISQKDYEKIFNQIEVEVSLKDNLVFKKEEPNIFINFLEGKNNYYIYFNDNKETIDRNYINKEDKVLKIRIIIEPEVKTFKGLFKDCKNIKEINFTKFNRNDIIDMSEMFYGCNSLTKINFYHFNTEKVTNMSKMFMQCCSLENLDLSIFNTKDVENMSFMFSQCNALKELDLSNFKTEKVTDMSAMFFGCTRLEKLNLSNFNFDNVTHIKGMFNICSSLIDLDFPQTNLEKATDAKYIFNLCKFELLCSLILKNTNLITKDVWGITIDKKDILQH